MTSSFTLNYGVRYEIDSQYNPLNTYYGDVGPRVSFAWDPFKDHKTVIRGGDGVFYGATYGPVPPGGLRLGGLDANRTTRENQRTKQQGPNQLKKVVRNAGGR